MCNCTDKPLRTGRSKSVRILPHTLQIWGCLQPTELTLTARSKLHALRTDSLLRRSVLSGLFCLNGIRRTLRMHHRNFSQVLLAVLLGAAAKSFTSINSKSCKLPSLQVLMAQAKQCQWLVALCRRKTVRNSCSGIHCRLVLSSANITQAV